VVTDQLMPGMTGLQLIAAIHRKLPSLPCLVVTGFAEMTAEEAGQCPILAKPFTQAQLAAALGRIAMARKVVPLRRRG